MKVLIVDDHIMFREGLSTLLSEEPDFEIIGEVSTIKESIKMALSLEPDLILMEINLPDGSGLYGVQTIVLQRPNINVVILTEQETEQYLIEAIRAGAKGFILKNIPVAKLIASLRGMRHGEAPLSRKMTSQVVEALYRIDDKVVGHLPALDSLTKRELEIIEQLTTGASNEEIAKILSISVNTVKNHVSRILDKLNLKNRHQVANVARRYHMQISDPTSSDESYKISF